MPDTFQFKGNVVSIDGNTITLNGVLVGAGQAVPETSGKGYNFSFRVDSSTRFEKLEIRMPTWDELLAANPPGPDGESSGSYKLEDMPQVKGDGSLEDLKNSLERGGLLVEANFEFVTRNSADPVPNLVFYQILTTGSQK